MKLNKYISEFLGTAFLFCAVVGSGSQAELFPHDEVLANDGQSYLLKEVLDSFVPRVS